MLKGEMCEISSSSAFNFGVSVCRSKSAQSDLGLLLSKFQPEGEFGVLPPALPKIPSSLLSKTLFLFLMDGGIIGGNAPDDLLQYFVPCPIFGIQFMLKIQPKACI